MVLALAQEREFSGRVRRVALFGSWARGEAHEESDVDVLVVIAGATSRERLRAIEIGAEVGLDHHLVIEPVALADAQWEDLVRRELRMTRENRLASFTLASPLPEAPRREGERPPPEAARDRHESDDGYVFDLDVDDARGVFEEARAFVDRAAAIVTAAQS